MPSGIYERKSTVKVYKNIPFKFAKYHKSQTKTSWKKQGLIFDKIGHTFDWWYIQYIYATHCDCCKIKFKNSLNRQMEHNHNITDAFNVRGIVCNGCNHRAKDYTKSKNTSGEEYISFHKIENKWRVKINRKDFKFMKRFETKEEAIIERNKIINSHSNFYSIK